MRVQVGDVDAPGERRLELGPAFGARVRRGALLVVLPALAVLVTPYGPFDTARYYRLMLIDAPPEKFDASLPAPPTWNSSKLPKSK